MIDRSTFRIVAGGLVAIVGACLLATAILAGFDKEAPDVLADAIKVGLGAIAALLARPPADGNEPVPVSVVGQPVMTEEVDTPKRKR